MQWHGAGIPITSRELEPTGATSGCSQSFRLWQRHTDQQCQYGTSGTLRSRPVISSQRAGLFTSGGHFIVLRGVTANGKVLVNDPNDSDAKNYINREFDMMSEIHATQMPTGSSTKIKEPL